jgi:hypothetical protein
MTSPLSNNPLNPRPLVTPGSPAPEAPAGPAEPGAVQSGAAPGGDSVAFAAAGNTSELGLNGTTSQWAELVWTPKTDLELPPQATENTAQWAEAVLTPQTAIEIPSPPPGEEIQLASPPPVPGAVVPPPSAPAMEAAPPPIRMASVSVGGSGMGAPASKTLTMTEDELIAVYSVLKQKEGMVGFEDLAKILKEEYGIDAEVKREGGMLAVVNRETGNVIAMDSNGDGMLTTHDMGFEQALTDLGIDPGSIQGGGNRNDGLALAAQVAKDALDTVEKMEQRRKADLEASRGIEAAAARTVTAGAPSGQGPTPGTAPAGTSPAASTPSAPASGGASTPSTKTPTV